MTVPVIFIKLFFRGGVIKNVEQKKWVWEEWIWLFSDFAALSGGYRWDKEEAGTAAGEQ